MMHPAVLNVPAVALLMNKPYSVSIVAAVIVMLVVVFPTTV